jgi:hypothetical protein
MTQAKVGELNGKWSVLFRVLLAINAIMFPVAISWATWVTTTLWELKILSKYSSYDRWTGAMAIEANDEEKVQNPAHNYLKAAEIREIQRKNNSLLAN